MKAHHTNIKQVIEQEMINAYGRIYKYRLYTQYGNDANGNSEPASWTAEFTKGKLYINSLTEDEAKMFERAEKIKGLVKRIAEKA